MVPEKVYEALPYVYVGGGIVVMVGFSPWFATLAGILIAMAGAIVWILRSDNRRSDIRKARQKYGGILPFWLYELLPFGYFMLALTLFATSNNDYFYPFAMILLVVGLHLWILRSSYRKHQRPTPAKMGPLRSRA